ncbi:Yip1 domain-containing protein [Pelagophyceae sp. CCMP2097]|nr:Yip1 domain-containing protein [Pelagophyceae sp. CCMP2097]
MFEPDGRRMVETTLDEPVYETIMRDLREVGAKLKLVVLPRMSQAGVLDRLKEWDLWGPLAVCLTLSISLCITAPESQRALVFAAVFFVIWVGAAIVTLNAQLLGGKISFFQSVCVLGYSVFPLNIAALVCLLMNLISNSGILRLFIVSLGFVWSTRVSVVFFSEIICPERRALAIYPVFGFYGFIAWMILIQ